MSSDRIINNGQRNLINLRRYVDDSFGISLDEVTTMKDVCQLLTLFTDNGSLPFSLDNLNKNPGSSIPTTFQRHSSYLTHSVFQDYHSEHELLRYMYRLQSKDLSLVHSMIPLGSCTMKLNATTEMVPVTWPEFSRLHPFAPIDQTQGYQMLFQQLEAWLADITGFSAVSLQPNAGSQGEYAGLMVIRAYQDQRGQGQRNICLIPVSAHGTNPASAVIAGLKVVSVACDSHGNIDIQDLEAKATQYHDTLACLMVTYPSTHGVFEEAIRDILKKYASQKD